MNASIEVQDLSFSYRRRSVIPFRARRTAALQNVTFGVSSGSVAGLVGHNGAGKTTLLLIAAGLKKPDEGSVRILGESAVSGALLARVGILTDRFRLDPGFRVGEVIRMFGSMHRLDRASAARPFEALQVAHLRDSFIKELSSGLRKRVAIAVAVMHDPEVFLLDEPFAGLDPESVRLIIDLVDDWRRVGKTIVISSHDLRELEEVIDELVVLREGKVLTWGRLFDLLSHDRTGVKVRIETAEGTIEVDPDPAVMAEALSKLAQQATQVMRVTTKGASLADLYTRLHLPGLEK